MRPLHPGTAIDDFLAAYEAEHGEITEEQVVGAARRTRTRAVVVRGRGVAWRGVSLVLDAGAFLADLMGAAGPR